MLTMTVNEVLPPKSSAAVSVPSLCPLPTPSPAHPDDAALRHAHSNDLALLFLAAAGAVRPLRAFLRSPHAPNLNVADDNGRTALHIACADGHTAIVKELLRSGADYTCRDRFDSTCVDDALLNGRIPVLRVLAQWGVPFPNRLRSTTVCPRYTLGRDLYIAVGEGNVKSAHQLIYIFGANVNYSNADGRTPLHIAAANADVQMAHLLLSAGADRTLRDRRGSTAADEAQCRGSNTLLTMLTDGQSQLPPQIPVSPAPPPSLPRSPSIPQTSQSPFPPHEDTYSVSSTQTSAQTAL